MASITAQQARINADKVNAPHLEQFKQGKTMDDICEALEDAANKGFYALNYGLGHNIHEVVVDYIREAFTKKGFTVQFDIDKKFARLLLTWK